MNIHIITSSYPAHPDDPTGTAGLFVRDFAVELAELGHRIVVQPAARKKAYQPDPGIEILPAPWKGGDRELASMNLMNPSNWWIFLLFFAQGISNTTAINENNAIDRTLCMWAVPSGIFGLAGKRKNKIPYDVWVLGSDIWKIRKIPFFGKRILGKVMRGADRVYADGFQLCRDVTELTGVPCEFLASSRRLPEPREVISFPDGPGVRHFLFVGRYHINKGPDLLIKAIANLPHDIRESIRLHMFGLGPLEGELKKMISGMKLGRYIHLNGPIQAQELSNYLNSVSYLVIPSRIESIPVVFSDAIQRGTPVVGMPVGDLESIVREFGCGLIAEDVSVDALASAIKKAALMDKDFFKEKTANAYSRFDIKRNVTQWLNHV